MVATVKGKAYDITEFLPGMFGHLEGPLDALLISEWFRTSRRIEDHFKVRCM